MNVTGADTLDGMPLTLVITSDLSKMEATFRALYFGDVRVIDADGKVLR